MKTLPLRFSAFVGADTVRPRLQAASRDGGRTMCAPTALRFAALEGLHPLFVVQNPLAQAQVFRW